MRDRASRWAKRALPVALAAAAFAGPAPHGMAEPKILYLDRKAILNETSAYRATIEDVNGDGHPDVLVLNNQGSKLTVLPGNGDGTFQPQKDMYNVVDPKGIAIGDFDQDGIADLAISHANLNIVSIWKGNGDGTFLKTSQVAAGSYPVGLAVGDWNRDGVQDLAVANLLSDNITIMLGIGGGTFVVTASIPAGARPAGLVAADFDGDGNLDIATANDGVNFTSVFLGKGNGQFDRRDFISGFVSDNLVAGDFNSDGRPDLAFAVNGEHNASILLGDVDGQGAWTFRPPIAYNIGSYPIDIAAGDYDGDGTTDLAVTVGGGYRLLLGRGDGTFEVTATRSGDGTRIGSGDLNDDGIEDLVFGSTNDGSTQLLLSQAEGTLAFDSDKYETNEDSGAVSLTVARTNGLHGRVKVAYTTVDDSGKAGIDYTATSGTLVFEDDETSKTISVPILDNNGYSGDRTFKVALSSPTNGAVLGSIAEATVTIRENEAEPDTTAPVVDAAKFSAVDNYSGTPDRLAGAAGAVGEADANVSAYAWTDADSDGVVDAGELGSPIALGVSAADGSVPGADIGDLPPGAYKFVVTARDAAGNESARDAGAAVAFALTKGDEPPPPDTSAPVVDAAKFSAVDNYSGTPDRLAGAAGAVGEADADVAAYPWTDADSDGVVDSGELGSPLALGVSAADGSVPGADIGDLPPGAYRFVVAARDAAGNESPRDASAVVAVTLAKGDAPEEPEPDKSAPTWPEGGKLAVSRVMTSSLTLTWPSASDNVGTTRYEIFRDGVFLTATDGRTLTFKATGLKAGAKYAFSVQALDAAGNRSEQLSASTRTASVAAPVLSSDAKLHALSLTAGDSLLTLTPAFDPNVFEYKAQTAEARIVLRFEANAAAKIRINGQDVSGVYEASLQPGDNLLTFDIQAENGESRSYRVTVVRQAPDPEPQTPFGDVAGHWAEASIREAASLGLIQGDERGNFRPDDELTRSEWLVMLARALKLESGSSEGASLPFSDAARIPAWARGQVASAVSSGIANGSFRPLQAVSRAEIAAILARSLHWEPQAANAPAFADASDIPAWALPSVQAAVQHGALEGRSGGRFEPNATATRAEAATILARLSKLTDPQP
ncbi:hypothetical protein J19TS2_26180 [Cohnella xylanilytica]|uniref:FG-GAP-like repeat-containing protein n=1 Tax=Cohnella xylanilytica TaxID=557555 RepID=UPI001B05D6F5|nr:FG-GAP-like repeat-containing protein [Cohnella xylanilytica]GIO13063.1 hypothetical protein J19TS2_26180 [Cohnella xylanilytica]